MRPAHILVIENQPATLELIALNLGMAGHTPQPEHDGIGIRLDPHTLRVTAGSQQLAIGGMELKLLNFFINHPERVHSRAQLLDQVWGSAVYVAERTVDTHVGRLRTALQPSGRQDCIETVRGSGYRYLEQEYLLHAIEAALPVQERRQFFLWSQGPLQALLPHQLMVCLQFGPDDVLQHIETLHSVVLDSALLQRVCDPQDGLALRLARACRAAQQLPAWLDASGSAGAGVAPLAAYLGELRDLGLDNFMVHGNGRTGGQDTVFMLFNLPQRPGNRLGY
eukprot:gene18482-18348_t